ncbi:hypothetical protein LK09_14975 [Microbacterium mangrovi]|uniref:GGDEF domain-containing protein n=1 Tax=Microbacterium mangrovi TaxID=1348253 RepID=A0A0B1ZZJ9_9MICO|nr:hypothetical protein LK09_14975 [Microbacterium mangrovi]
MRAIGRLQSYGFLLGVDEETGTVTVASANAEHYLGRTLRDESDRLGWILDHASAVDPVRAEVDGKTVEVIVHRGTSPLLVECEFVVDDLEYARTAAVGAIERVAAVDDIDELPLVAAREIKAITGFDRVMFYDFHADGHGQIVADEREPDMVPYFGLHFPASDIPSQARALYVEKRSRVIADTDDPGVDVLTLLPEERPVDLGPTELRASSPHHLVFMRNMGQAATLSLSLVEDGKLVGLITCAHRTPRRLPVLLRRALEVLAAQVTAQRTLLQRVRTLQRRIDTQERLSGVLAALFERADAGEALTTGEHTLLDIVPADGVVVRLSGEVHTVGLVPPPASLFRAVGLLGDGRHAVEALPLQHPEAAAAIPGIAGLLVVPLDRDDVIVFVRNEVVQTVEWLGDQRPENREHALSPRRSFSAWSESVAGHSLPWGTHAQDAFEFGDRLRSALASREQAELALRDPLTGLYNRRFLEQLLSTMSAEDYDTTSVIFLDVDDFKGINDTHGHATGDTVLRVLAQRLRGSVRDEDRVIRLGGDEFLIVCAETDVAEARGIAERALATVARPIRAEGETLSVRVSGGLVTGGTDIVTSADAAMYRAKKAGGGRISL